MQRFVFQCSSASRKFLNSIFTVALETAVQGFSALQRAENSSTCEVPHAPGRSQSFSALQRAENSSTGLIRLLFWSFSERFQCSSASRKFLNWCSIRSAAGSVVGFSALQRAENSSTVSFKPDDFVTALVSVLFSEPKIPQPRTGR